jgi:hypothetical protein
MSQYLLYRYIVVHLGYVNFTDHRSFHSSVIQTKVFFLFTVEYAYILKQITSRTRESDIDMNKKIRLVVVLMPFQTICTYADVLKYPLKSKTRYKSSLWNQAMGDITLWNSVNWKLNLTFIKNYVS